MGPAGTTAVIQAAIRRTGMGADDELKRKRADPKTMVFETAHDLPWFLKGEQEPKPKAKAKRAPAKKRTKKKRA